MYIQSDLEYNPRDDLQNKFLEDLWLELLLPKTKPILVGTCYRAPNNTNAIYCMENTLSKLRYDCDTILMGDFNFCLLKNKTIKFSQLLNDNGFTHQINSPTHVTNTSSSLIDHIYVNNYDKISQSGVLETGISDHFVTYCTRKVIRGQVGIHNKIKLRSMKHYNKETFIEKLNSCDWSVVSQIVDDVDLAWENLAQCYCR